VPWAGGVVVTSGYGHEPVARSLSVVIVTTRRDPLDQLSPEDDLGYLQI
jgi:hypothetical protein